jgi:hypothetical protein
MHCSSAQRRIRVLFGRCIAHPWLARYHLTISCSCPQFLLYLASSVNPPESLVLHLAATLLPGLPNRAPACHHHNHLLQIFGSTLLISDEPPHSVVRRYPKAQAAVAVSPKVTVNISKPTTVHPREVTRAVALSVTFDSPLATMACRSTPRNHPRTDI